ncbi:type I-Fv CRISPR-associated protein Cas5fv [Vibrio alfacsensis]|uniref:type I-Fv CRISPR-associated protein Cas5fv n=1 Tax=Vibrio alfacsensis TaxID=1074311 RepID=UPI002ADD3F63|nr:type I-Fv CRISPR-associated protein Cas5fv [Vibrio alfacsensis]WQE78183.1 type I-Fv CRISPR-associated protein Cas5fv [Vibrio alfacsensis]
MNKTLRVRINYNSKYCNQFLDGSNNEPLPKNGRKFAASMGSLKTNTRHVDITQNTVLGVLSRLIGDQRKLYQARNSDDFYFADILDKITFKKHEVVPTDAIVFLRNMGGSHEGGSGLVNAAPSIFTVKGTSKLWSVLYAKHEDIPKIVTGDIDPPFIKHHDFDTISERFKEIKKLNVDYSEDYKECIETFVKSFPQSLTPKSFLKKNPEKLKVEALYCSLIYYWLQKLIKLDYNFDELLTGNEVIQGISKATYTEKDFMLYKYKGGKKIAIGNPTVVSKKVVGSGGKSENIPALTIEDGILDIYIEVDVQRAKEIKEAIEAARVTTFTLGKKGLAYVEGIKYASFH